MEIPHKDYLIVPGARQDELDRWMPVVLVRWRSTQDGTYWTWPAKPIVSERHKSYVEAERRSLEIAKQMIDRGNLGPASGAVSHNDQLAFPPASPAIDGSRLASPTSTPPNVTRYPQTQQ